MNVWWYLVHIWWYLVHFWWCLGVSGAYLIVSGGVWHMCRAGHTSTDQSRRPNSRTCVLVGCLLPVLTRWETPWDFGLVWKCCSRKKKNFEIDFRAMNVIQCSTCLVLARPLFN